MKPEFLVEFFHTINRSRQNNLPNLPKISELGNHDRIHECNESPSSVSLVHQHRMMANFLTKSFLLLCFTFITIPSYSVTQIVTGPAPFPSLRHVMTLGARRRLRNVVISAMASQYLMQSAKPKKGILPIPLPLPFPVPIEWEQPPVVVHPKTEVVAVNSDALKRNEADKTTSTTTTTPRPPPPSHDR